MPAPACLLRRHPLEEISVKKLPLFVRKSLGIDHKHVSYELASWRSIYLLCRQQLRTIAYLKYTCLLRMQRLIAY